MVGWKGKRRKENKERERGKNYFLCVFGCRREEKGERGNKKIIIKDHFTILSL